ncbi:MAG: phosphatase PAP2 family protein [Tannerella sp.]|jgi:membrane-associated phospholipid phosphatase|nr:phosphatase PAP2 family protein [Tannerella sp.]
MKKILFITGFILVAGMVFSKEDTLQISLYERELLPASLARLPQHSSFLAGRQPFASVASTSGEVERLSATRFITPALFIAYGTAARFNDTPFRRFDKYVAEQVELNIDGHYPIDSYLAAVPAAVAYGLDFLPGVASQHNFRDRTLILATSYLFMWGTVTFMKQQIPVVRPRGWNSDAFPSGHTAVAFTGAHILYREYREQSPWIGVGGYAVATMTGALRVINRAHWMSDIVAGAGIGILSAEIGYMMLPVWHSLFGIDDDRQLVIMPSVGARNVGVGLVYLF